MAVDFDELCRTLSMTEIVRLQDMLTKSLALRFERPMALAFSDVVGSTPYFQRFGDAAGRQLQQRHFDLLAQAIGPRGGRVVDTAGDGAFFCFASVDAAAEALVELQKSVSADNVDRAFEHHLSLRVGLHFGPVLTDGEQVCGDAVNLCARVSASGPPGELRLTREAFTGLRKRTLRLNCRGLPSTLLKGMARPQELLALDWRDRAVFPSQVRLETGEEIVLPDQDLITFGRLREHDGVAANDVVLGLKDKNKSQQISRWHFEVRRRPEGLVLRPVSDSLTEVEGQKVAKGEDVPVRAGTKVRVGNVLTLEFCAASAPDLDDNDDKTLQFQSR